MAADLLHRGVLSFEAQALILNQEECGLAVRPGLSRMVRSRTATGDLPRAIALSVHALPEELKMIQVSMIKVSCRFGIALLLMCLWLAAGLSAEAQTSSFDAATLPADMRALMPGPEESQASIVDKLSRLNALHKSALTALNAASRQYHVVLAGDELYGPIRGTYEFAAFRTEMRKNASRMAQIAGVHDLLMAEMRRRSIDIASVPAGLAKRPQTLGGSETSPAIEPSCLVIKAKADCAKRADCAWSALMDSRPNLPLGGRLYCVDKRDAEISGECWPMRKC